MNPSPNATPARTLTARDGALAGLETPAVVIDRPALEANIALGAAIAHRHKLALRPHIKTHKSPVIAKLQIEAGAAGITASKTDEALVFIEAGIPSITVAYPLIDRAKISRLIRAAKTKGTDLRIVADSAEGIAVLSGEARAQSHRLPVFLKVDVGLHRCGVDPALRGSLDLAAALERAPGLRFAGLLAHAGHAYGAGTPEGVRKIAAEERELLLGFAEKLYQMGIEVREISVGSTPTVILNDDFTGLTEARPGNYVFMDMTQVALGVARPEQVALSVLATVVSRNDRYAIVDAGSKVMSSDRGPHGSDSLRGFDTVFALGEPDAPALGLTRLSEEHGFVEHGGRKLEIGSRVRILPNHACPVANLADRFAVIDAGGGTEYWPIEARGCVR
ncbi:alanine racemase [Hypericibacter adhaerens]|uniref:Alanine racemase n=1 Tax=Hypericibacter adhaerens TaxID=2602016 RepID=A0A5J6N0K7_9PROT|nr:alanine racemase [Hypericibacter adhaerens]QEX20416.1 alanine racemase [Hypericibacter adhaerens]